ncbi:response regulator transcription factor [Kocuria sp.]|uniref:response regulator transcription factor n=1 Tax=Kocuria sp. TaxID=1871328 RepID=UPI0026DF7920|nr:response regulator transcription factor [Kocuria sp.]MDO5618848.1 response regulator transcription factor [Kocuria sp.]
MRIFLAEDAALIRAGIQEVLTSAGYDVIGVAADADELVEAFEQHLADATPPDLILTDVRMPPTGTDDGLRAALNIRRLRPEQPIVVLSAYVSGPYVRTLLGESGHGGGLGYLLKERVGKVSDFLSSLEVVAGGGVVIDPDVVAYTMKPVADGPVGRLSPREREVLQLMAEGLSNAQIEDRLVVSPAAVSKHVANIFTKLELPPGEDNRRVRAVLMWLRADESAG